jgi:hypothetical protein
MSEEMILLGAGASREAGVPIARDMCKEILDRLKAPGVRPGCFKALSVAIGGLIFQASTSANPFDGTNIEAAFNAIEALSERDSMEFAPFVSGWHSSLEQVELPSPAQRNSAIGTFLRGLDAALKRAPSGITGRSRSLDSDMSLVRSFEQAVTLAVNSPNRSAIWKRTLLEMTKSLVEITWLLDATKVSYLKPLLEYCWSDEPNKKIPIATLNYDNAVELCGTEIAKRKVDTGIVKYIQNGSFEFADDAIPLLKLHGSTTWEQSRRSTNMSTPYAEFDIKELTSPPNTRSNFQPAVIFGRRNKLTAEGPFLLLLAEFESKLSKANNLTVVGYSFADPHINHVIGRWLNRNDKRTIKLINGESFDIRKSPLVSDDFCRDGYILHRITNTEKRADASTMPVLFSKS